MHKSPNTHLPLRGLLLTLLCLPLVALACGSDDGGSDAPEATLTARPAGDEETPGAETTAPTPQITTEISVGTPSNPGDLPFSGDPISEPANEPGTATLLLATAAEGAGFDRTVFQFDPGYPAYFVQRVDAPVECGSGAPVDIQGSSFVQIRMTGTQAHDEQGSPTVDLTELDLNLPAVLEAEQTCDFEGEVIWVLGLSAPLNFRAYSLGSDILVVEVEHP
jgi:hypothetical protein